MVNTLYKNRQTVLLSVRTDELLTVTTPPRTKADSVPKKTVLEVRG